MEKNINSGNLLCYINIFQQNSLTALVINMASTTWQDFKSADVQKRSQRSLHIHTFVFTLSRWSKCIINVTNMSEFLLTNVTHESSVVVEWLQQMLFELVKPSKTVLSYHYRFVPVSISIWNFSSQSSVAVYITSVIIQMVWSCETFVAQRTFVWFLSHVDDVVSHVSAYSHRLCLVTDLIFVLYLVPCGLSCERLDLQTD